MNNKDHAINITNHTSFAYTSVDHMMITLNAQRISDYSVMNSCSYYTGSEKWYLGDLVTIRGLNKPSRDREIQI